MGEYSLAAGTDPIAVTLFYYDQRIRKEGFDIEHMMQCAGLIPDADFAFRAVDTALRDSAPVAAEELGA